MLGQGLTKGVFQLESPLGRKPGPSKLKPESYEHMAALGSLLRPGRT
jgi:DNA polymerase III alpha subunit